MLRALDAALLLADVRSGAVNLAVLHVTGPLFASLNEIREAAATIGGGAPHFLVKNHVNDTAFDLAEDPRFAGAFARAADVTVNVPKLSEAACEEIQRRGLGLAAFRDRRRVAHAARLCGDVARPGVREFDRVDLRGLMA